MATCKFEFNNKSIGVYYSGQTITGTVLLENEKSRKINSISLAFEGFAECKWTDYVTKNQIETFKGSQNLINDVKFLVSGVQGKQIELPEGLHKYKFSFRIPEYFPSSIESSKSELFSSEHTYGLQGSIYYVLMVKVNRKWKFDIKFEFPLTIIKNYDLNSASSRYRIIGNTKNFTFSSKALKMSVDTPCVTFIGGESAKFLINYKNESSNKINETKVELIRINQYTSDLPEKITKISSECIVASRFEGVAGKSSKIFEAFLLIPSVVPSSNGSCSVLSISYEIHVTAVFGRSALHTINIPILIGTIPLLPRDAKTSELRRASAPPLKEGTSSSSLHDPRIESPRGSIGWSLGPSTSTAFSLQPVASAPEENDLPPPSYYEATKGDAKNPSAEYSELAKK